jgi:hypothetical protein
MRKRKRERQQGDKRDYANAGKIGKRKLEHAFEGGRRSSKRSRGVLTMYRRPSRQRGIHFTWRNIYMRHAVVLSLGGENS